MHHVVALIAERQRGTCTNQLSAFVPIVECCEPCKTTIEPGVSLEAAFLYLQGRGKVVYILPSSDPTLALLLMGFT
ncbi:hypothetical protein Hanom_Chr05g00393991 [Helianthus anomalus]